MNFVISKSKYLLRQHWLALTAAVLVGVIYGGPHIWFAAANQDYQGIPMLQSANDSFYIARIREILDDHPLLGSYSFFEYKNQLPLSPPTGELLYAAPTLLFGMPLMAVLAASKFFLPFVLFLLVYALAFKLLGESQSWSQKISAAVGATLVTLGYDLVDYRTVWKFITGAASPGGWLIWSRPVNPILGAIFLFAFLLFIWAIIQNKKHPRRNVFGAGIFLALMFASYFFSWGVALSILGVAGFMYLWKRDYVIVRRFIAVLAVGLILSAPYWYLAWQAKNSIWFQDAALRNGLFYTHYPLWNKVLLVALALYAVILFLKFYKNFRISRLEPWHFFTFAFLFGGLLALNQQVITGLTIWPFHFVQYTIPLAMIAIMTVLYWHMRDRWPLLWKGLMAVIILASLWLGIYTQLGTYKNSLAYNLAVQSYVPVFNWLNQQEKDCVVLVSDENLEQSRELTGLIPAFTHCNQYAHFWVSSLMPEERIYHSYLVNLRLRGVTSENVEDYIKQNREEAHTYLSSNWKGLSGIKLFPDFADLKLTERLARLSRDYSEFLKKDFETELKKYRLDFILSSGPLPKWIKKDLPDIRLVKEMNGLEIYKFPGSSN